MLSFYRSAFPVEFWESGHPLRIGSISTGSAAATAQHRPTSHDTHNQHRASPIKVHATAKSRQCLRQTRRHASAGPLTIPVRSQPPPTRLKTSTALTSKPPNPASNDTQASIKLLALNDAHGGGTSTHAFQTKSPNPASDDA